VTLTVTGDLLQVQHHRGGAVGPGLEERRVFGLLGLFGAIRVGSRYERPSSSRDLALEGLTVDARRPLDTSSQRRSACCEKARRRVVSTALCMEIPLCVCGARGPEFVQVRLVVS